ncbi:MAG: ubiquinone/menaquinone biosynthesis methyltransferase [Anaerolineae bacterium]
MKGNHSIQAKPSDQRAVRALFTRIAPYYDTLNRLISMGQDQRLRRRAVQWTQLPEGGTLLDVGTGTGDVALTAAARRPDCKIVGLDPTEAMLRQAQGKRTAPAPAWTLGDGLTLPYPNDAFDAVISAFLMRNVPDVVAILAEQTRVVRPGGRVVCLELTWPRRFPVSPFFHVYFFGWVPLMGRLLSGDRTAYTYLPRSIKGFMRPQTLAHYMANVGLTRVRWEGHIFGSTTLFVGQKPGARAPDR